ncbi:MurR/RpiR family transcriptional regulator [Halocella sp. SP3-1]|uniref:MurR/RpiR family transcriptional regulator n=1 Tax=Halocella sp. SP3-1 TaxID=2382161 RepID=UPI000F75E1D3|nr:MurR/RpiR family transcriptional regulator [Halocella sp. SP3-1]AZO94442.1 MurR/RpiR family transcriptional regulator [Halocella sp. SP3-1]
MKIYNLDIDINQLSKSEKKIANFITKNMSKVPYLNLQELSKAIGVSIATISRFCVSIGFSGFKDFKNHIKNNYEISPANKMKSILNEIRDEDIGAQIINKTINYLKKTIEYLSNDNFNRAIKSINTAEDIYIFSPGPSESVANLLFFRLNRFGLNVNKMAKSGKELFENLINLSKDDLIIIFGFFNVSPEIKIILDYKKKIGFKTILITDLIVSEMNKTSDIILYVERGEIWEFHTMVTPMALIEALIVGITINNEEKYLKKLNNLHELRKHYANYLTK